MKRKSKVGLGKLSVLSRFLRFRIGVADLSTFNSAIFKKFPTQAAAQAFIEPLPTAAKTRTILPPTATPYSLAIFAPKPLKSIATTEWAKDYYGVKLGRRPGVYTDW